MFKKYFPRLFDILKFYYQKTNFYKLRVARNDKIQRKLSDQKDKNETDVIRDIFDNQYLVQNGNFKGMKYIKRSSGSALLPKLLGSYEEPIQVWVKEVIDSNKYENILDIGAAEGYYACGFAMRMPNVKITTYDTDEVARNNAAELMELNGLSNVEIKGECSHQELNLKSNKNTLIFCDIEGFEEVLLDPIKVPNLKNDDILVESHDCFVKGLTEKLIHRFYKTHKLKIVVDYPFRLKS